MISLRNVADVRSFANCCLLRNIFVNKHFISRSQTHCKQSLLLPCKLRKHSDLFHDNKCSRRSFSDKGDHDFPTEFYQEHFDTKQEKGLKSGSLSKIECFANDNQNIAEKLFELFRTGDDKISVRKFFQALLDTGLSLDDQRLSEVLANFKKFHKCKTDIGIYEDLNVDKDSFINSIRNNIVLINSSLQHEFVIPDFKSFKKRIEKFYWICKENTGGQIPNYIPQLSKFSPDLWGVSLCSVDGQRFSIGDTKVDFTIQSIGKSFNYAIALSELGEDIVHKYVGQEPSGRMFNEIVLDHNNMPHNPMINAGAIIISSLLLSLVKPEMKTAEKFDWVCNKFETMAGGFKLRFNNATYLSERDAAFRNYAIGFYLKEHKCYPANADLNEALDFYFQLCSLEVNCESLAIMASTLANGGICPITGQQVIESQAVRNVLTLMHSCGMYDYSGQFAFKVGLPAKSGVSGCLMLIVPNCLGIGLFSPPLDHFGNSVRGVQFCDEMVKMFNFHHYDNLRHTAKKEDPRREWYDKKGHSIVGLLFGAANGDISAMTRYYLAGMDMAASDYDGRTALHLAAAEGHISTVKFLLRNCKVNPYVKDRWGHTPIHEAETFQHEEVVNYITQFKSNDPVGIKEDLEGEKEKSRENKETEMKKEEHGMKIKGDKGEEKKPEEQEWLLKGKKVDEGTEKKPESQE